MRCVFDCVKTTNASLDTKMNSNNELCVYVCVFILLVDFSQALCLRPQLIHTHTYNRLRIVLYFVWCDIFSYKNTEKTDFLLILLTQMKFNLVRKKKTELRRHILCCADGQTKPLNMGLQNLQHFLHV